MKRLLGGAGAALGLKIVTGIAVAAAAAVVAGAATEVAVTGSANPTVWGQQVKTTVATCKDTLRASGTRGIGLCCVVGKDTSGSPQGRGRALLLEDGYRDPTS